jgi:hypothetical protein
MPTEANQPVAVRPQVAVCAGRRIPPFEQLATLAARTHADCGENSIGAKSMCQMCQQDAPGSDGSVGTAARQAVMTHCHCHRKAQGRGQPRQPRHVQLEQFIIVNTNIRPQFLSRHNTKPPQPHQLRPPLASPARWLTQNIPQRRRRQEGMSANEVQHGAVTRIDVPDPN